MSGKCLHVFTNDKFVGPWVELLERWFDFQDHEVLVWHSPDYPNGVPQHPNVRLLGRMGNRITRLFLAFTVLQRQCQSARMIFVHGLFSPYLVAVLFLFPWLLRKSIWIIWGSDLYRYRKPLGGWIAKAYEAIRRAVIRNFAAVASTIDGDFELARSVYKVRGKRIKPLYPNPIPLEFLKTLYRKEPKRRSRGVLLGNSADETNQHHEAIEALAFLKKENVDIYCPLNYAGSSSYVESVIQHGRSVFGEQFRPLTALLPFEVYAAEILSQVDVAVMPHDRQQGVNNIKALAFLGAKIYLRESISTFAHLRSLQLTVFPYERIGSENPQTFFEFEARDREDNRQYIESHFSLDRVVESWKPLFASGKVP